MYVSVVIDICIIHICIIIYMYIYKNKYHIFNSKKILKITFNKPKDFSTVSLFKENKMLSLYDICKYKTSFTCIKYSINCAILLF